MKLVEILARELKGWPNGWIAVGQACDGSLHGEPFDGRHTEEKYSICDQHVTEEVTRAEWQAAVDALGIPKFPSNGVEWNGEGLPPVGVVCEHEGSDGWSNPFKVEVIAHKPFFGHEDGGLLVVFATDSDVSFSSAECFRPVRTPEQITISAMMEDLCISEKLASVMLARGYRKFEIVEGE